MRCLIALRTSCHPDHLPWTSCKGPWTWRWKLPGGRWLCCPVAVGARNRLPCSPPLPSAGRRSSATVLLLDPGEGLRRAEKQSITMQSWWRGVSKWWWGGSATFIMISGGMQWVSSSYNLARTSNNLEKGRTGIQLSTVWSCGRGLSSPSPLSPLRALLAHDGIGCFPEVNLPVSHWHFLVCGEWIPGKDGQACWKVPGGHSLV